jgi:anti-sigma factor RsiW
MSCNVNGEVWFDYVENELDPSFKKDLSMHLEKCDECQKNYAEYKQTRQLLGTEKIKMPSDASFDRMANRIMAVLDEVPQKVQRESNVVRPVWFQRFAVPMAAAAALVLVILGGFLTTPSFNGNRNSLAKQENMTEQYIEQTESTNPQVVGHSLVTTSQDEDDMVLDAAAAKLSHMSDTEARTMLDNMK